MENHSHTKVAPAVQGDVINGVPRDMLEEVLIDLESGMMCNPSAETLSQLRALLTAQPQASVAQSAPAGEREAEAAAIAEEIDWLIRQWDAGVNWSGERMAELLEAAGKAAEMLTAQQRTQAAGVPDGVEWIACSERLPEHGGPVAVWCSGSESPGVAWMRQGAWYMPEPQAIGYDTITHWAPFPPAPAQPVGEMISSDGDIYWTDSHPPMGTKLYAAPIAQTTQPEVQRLQIALRLSANRLDRLALEFPYASDMRWTASEWANEARSALATSTGQGVDGGN